MDAPTIGVTVTNPQLSRVGDYATPETLLEHGGVFYQVYGEAFCDTALGTWKLESPYDPGYRRIE